MFQTNFSKQHLSLLDIVVAGIMDALQWQVGNDVSVATKVVNVALNSRDKAMILNRNTETARF